MPLIRECMDSFPLVLHITIVGAARVDEDKNLKKELIQKIAATVFDESQ